jgi:hypothetical protein
MFSRHCCLLHWCYVLVEDIACALRSMPVPVQKNVWTVSRVSIPTLGLQMRRRECDADQTMSLRYYVRRWRRSIWVYWISATCIVSYVLILAHLEGRDETGKMLRPHALEGCAVEERCSSSMKRRVEKTCMGGVNRWSPRPRERESVYYNRASLHSNRTLPPYFAAPIAANDQKD